LILTIVGLLAIVGTAGLIGAYFVFVRKDSPPQPPPAASLSPAPVATATPVQNGTPDQTQALKDELEKLKRQVNEQKNTKNNPPVPSASTTQSAQTIATARVDSPNDGFLALRSEPSTQNGYMLLKIPHGATVSVTSCQSSTAVGSRRGRWCRVNYAGQQGWSFDGFLVY
jgi:hypothetical protein